MKKFTVAVIIIGVFVLYSLIYNHSSSNAISPAMSNEPSTSSSSSSAGSSTTNTNSATSTPSTTGSTSSGGQFKDGTYTGSTADATYGYIQVKATIQNGKLTNVQFLQAPNDRGTSIEINSYADPQLAQEAVQAQSANVDVITGATDSSEAFIQSLSSALSQAKA
ncbi:MAG TPA: FMN-binding protein [Dictyobacter sp.]|jgi:uncharacterized protein with FMN-binding domain|nr:FMN-binding protein [Dictyobacter sp.]